MRRAAWIGAVIVAVLLCTEMPGRSQQVGATPIFGGRGGSDFTDLQPAVGTRVIEVRIWSGDRIDSVQLVYAAPNAGESLGVRHGGSGGRMSPLRLQADEYITGISGRYGDNIDSMRIHTNRRVSPLYGGRGGDRDYAVQVPSGMQAVGFAGRTGDLVDAIGLIYVPIPRQREQRFPQTQLAGGRGGRAFSDQDIPVNARVAEVRIQSGDLIDSVQLIYVLPDGRYVDGVRHGGRSGRASSFRLDRDEYIIGIFGRCGDNIDSLAIQTNKRSSPIFGGRGGNRDYRLTVPSGNQALGFAGRAGSYLDAIGLTYTRIYGGRVYRR